MAKEDDAAQRHGLREKVKASSVQPRENKTQPPFEPRPQDARDRVSISPEYLKGRVVVVDTGCFLARSARSVLLEQALPSLEAAGKHFCIFSRTLDFLEDSDAHAKMELAAWRVAQAKEIVRVLQARGCLVDFKDPEEGLILNGNTESAFLVLLNQEIQQHAYCVLTQNGRLARSILEFARAPAFEHKERTQQPDLLALHRGELRNWAPRLLGRDCRPPAENPRSRPIERYIADGYKILVDTCSLMQRRNDVDELLAEVAFGGEFQSLLSARDNKLIVFGRVLLELEKHMREGKPQVAEAAAAGLKAVERLQSAGRAVIVSKEREVTGSERFVDPLFRTELLSNGNRADLCIITQDNNLVDALLETIAKDLPEPVCSEVIIAYVDKRSGRLRDWLDRLASQSVSESKAPIKTTPDPHRSQPRHTRRANDTQNNKSHRQATTEVQESHQGPGATHARVARFADTNTLRPVDSTLVEIATVPGSGAEILAEHSGRFVLGTEIACGGEGTIYATLRADLFCKIYHADCLTKGRVAKLEVMLSRDIEIPGVCWPTERVSTLDGQTVGFLMPRANGIPLTRSIFNKKLFEKRFPDWNRIDLTQLAISILRTIRKLHQRNICIGDINGLNILAESPQTVAFVDTDSFQLDGFPCPVGTETFTPPARLGQNYAEFLRSKDDELFAVTTLLFMVLFAGKGPYASQGGGEVAENIREMRFPYAGPYAEQQNQNRKPSGSWQFIWSHLHLALKQDFEAVFATGKRVPINTLIRHLQDSIKAMEAGRDSDALFPREPWSPPGDTSETTCSDCGKVFSVRRRTLEDAFVRNNHWTCTDCKTLARFGRTQRSQVVECRRCGQMYRAGTGYLAHMRSIGKTPWCKTCAEEARAGLPPPIRAGARVGGSGSQRTFGRSSRTAIRAPRRRASRKSGRSIFSQPLKLALGLLTALGLIGGWLVTQSGGERPKIERPPPSLYSPMRAPVYPTRNQNGYDSMYRTLPAPLQRRQENGVSSGIPRFEPRNEAARPNADPPRSAALIATEDVSVKPGSEVIRHAQEALARLGWDPGPADGMRGPRTMNALLDYQLAVGLPLSGEVDAATIAALRAGRTGKLDRY